MAWHVSASPTALTGRTWTELYADLRDRTDRQGVAYYTDVQSRFQGVEGLRPALFKTTEQALTHQSFRSLVANAASTCVFAHIRFATQAAIVTTNNRS